MIIRKTFGNTSCRLICAFALAGLAGCSAIKSFYDSNRVDYKSASKKSSPKLEVPPDLVQMQNDERYSLPEGGSGAVTASSYGRQATATAPAVATTPVALNAAGDMHLERDGNAYWLVSKQAPEVLWPKIKAFWLQNGFAIETDLPQVGVMETDWKESHATFPQGVIRGTLDKAFGSHHTPGERDKFRTRLERRADGSTEITISQRGLEEILTGPEKDTATWAALPSDPGLEAEYLSRLMISLNPQQTPDQAKAMVANAGSPATAAPQVAHAKVVTDKSGSHVEMDEGFDRAWRRVGLALDRAGFTVEDRDRSQGVFYVRYLDLGTGDHRDAQPGFFARVFAGKKKKTAQRYRVLVKETGESASQVTVANGDGTPENSSTGERILSVLTEQLK